jgi:hypothetical protein
VQHLADRRDPDRSHSHLRSSFANPAVTVARALSDTFAGIALSNVPAFIVARHARRCGPLAVQKAVAVLHTPREWLPVAFFISPRFANG